MSLAILVPTASFARTDPTPVIHGDAQVRVGDGADFTVAPDGAPVASGTTVRAQASSAARIDVAEGVSLRLAPGAVVTVRNFSWLPAEHPGAQAVRALQINLMGGEVDLTSHSKDPSGDLGMTILLPEGRSFALWRGDANVKIDGDNVDAALYEGMAIAGAGAKWKPLPGGKGVVIPIKGDPTLRPIPGTPAWADAQSKVAPFAVVRGNGGGVVGAAWGDAPGAASYRVEIAHDTTMSGPLTVTSTTTPQFQSDPLASGAYAIRVRAISADGILGRPSTPKVLRVVRLTLPKGATVASDGTVVLSATSAVNLDDPRDIEIATVVNHGAPDNVLFWTPASNDLSLGPTARREVRIRHAITHVETTVLLVRRDLRAHVSFTPKPARWPQDTITITVKLEDPTGYVDATKENIQVDTKIDIDAVDLKWAHAGDTWTAQLPPKNTGAVGPWVVRVDVLDASGADIGASILDVDGPGDAGFQQARFNH
jgi:hypothetical protein